MFTNVTVFLFQSDCHNGNRLLSGACVTSYHIPVIINKTSNLQAEWFEIHYNVSTI